MISINAGGPDCLERKWKCNLGNGQWDHDWQEKYDSTGEVDGGPGDCYAWRECRACGAIDYQEGKAIPEIIEQ